MAKRNKSCGKGKIRVSFKPKKGPNKGKRIAFCAKR